MIVPKSDERGPSVSDRVDVDIGSGEALRVDERSGEGDAVLRSETCWQSFLFRVMIERPTHHLQCPVIPFLRKYKAAG